jgi:polyhydroxyalkanoate synthesis repressor PhaR
MSSTKMNKANGKTVIIKKYGNRRLYDVTNSAYINQYEVAAMVQKGYNVQVLDAETGQDLTRLVLTQIIVQHAKEPESAFPLDILRQMVVACGKATRENTLKYTQAVLDMYQNAYRAITPPLNPFEFMQMPPSAPNPAAPPVESRSQTAGSYEVRTAPNNKKDETAEVGELKRRLQELESLVSEFGARKAQRNRSKNKSRKSR